MKPDPTQPIFVRPGSGTVVDFLSITPKLTSEQTEGTFYLSARRPAGEARRR